jgi:RND family efflux transporter MFP subunit
MRTIPAWIALTLLVSGCGREAVVELPPPVVTVAKAIEQSVQDWDEYTGRLAAVGTVDIRPRVSGYITEVKFSDGDIVKSGQPLFVIDPRPYQADLDRAQGEYARADAAFKLAQIEFERAKQLRDRGVSAVADFDLKSATLQQAQGTLASAKSALDAAQLNLEFCTITSPIDGRASLAKITVGNLVNANSSDPLTTVVTTNPIYAYADVDERSLLRYVRFYQSKHVGPEAADEVDVPIELALQDETGFPHRGTIDFIDNRVDPETGTIRLRGVFNSEKGLLGPGLFVRVRIPSGEPYTAVLVPQRSVGFDQGSRFAVVINPDNTAEFRTVTIGTLHEGWVVVKNGVQAGEQVVVDGVLKVRPGQKVEPKPAPVTPPGTD